MKENLALIKKKQKSFNSSVNKYKNLLKKGEIKVQEAPVEKKALKVKERGIVYVGNTPHGFYEKQMRDYFKQFGVVTRIRVARSRKTGAAKGYAFVEFKEPEVAEIVSETMNNYLMGKRLLKAQYISPEEQVNKDYFKGKNFTPDKYPKLVDRKKNKSAVNSIISDDKMIEKNKIALRNMIKIKSKLKALGIEYDFKPVDVPLNMSDEIKLLSSNKPSGETESSSDSESTNSDVCSNDDSSDGIIFTPPEELAETIKEKLNQKNKNFNQKLTGITKTPKTKVSKQSSTKINDKKANLIKIQINNKDQIKIKSPKKINAKKNALKKKSPKK